ncbi:MAG: type II toxin-antitoxin system VapC family toxin [Nitrosomonadales bacterium]|nr:type II toxin-antitoxin system VapC family toxin [Nitrosomonadales bacterium]
MRGQLIDTDVLIWYLRGHPEAGRLLDSLAELILSAVTYMELMQGCRDKRELSLLKKDMGMRGTRILPIDANISDRAVSLIETHALSGGLQMADALIAATGLIHGLSLVTGNAKHFVALDGLIIERFIP